MTGFTTCTATTGSCKAVLPITTPTKPSPINTASLSPASTEKDAERISPMARQLSDAVQRAKQRDSNLGREQLQALAQKTLAQIYSVSFATPNIINDNERPNTDDPQILDRARKANAYILSQGPNPFKGMTPELLTAITYDDSGTFTLHERTAAWSESYNQREAWGSRVAAESMLEYRLTRGDTRAYGQMLDYYRNQPRIEQVQMPDNYEKELLEKIASIVNSPDQWHDVSLYDVLRRWLTSPPQHQTLFSIMANEAQSRETQLPEFATRSTHTVKSNDQPSDSLNVRIALQKAISPKVPLKTSAT